MSTNKIHSQRILILDFGSQYTQLIARRVREAGVFCEIVAYDIDAQALVEYAPNGIILSGGPETVTAEDSPKAEHKIFELGVPVLGICYGMQFMAQYFGGAVEASQKHEFGYARVTKCNDCELFSAFEDARDAKHSYLDVWMSHGDKVVRLPQDFELAAATDSAPIAAMQHSSQPFYGLQFHPEVTHTLQGQQMIEHFVRELCNCDGLWTAQNIIDDAIATIRDNVGDDEVVLGLSGGVDSSVVAALLHRAIGDQLSCVFVDNGLLRLEEGEQVMAMFSQDKGMRVIRVDAKDEFLSRLEGESDPEQKRKIIGNTFIEVFEREAAKLENAQWLAQGTIYPDVIESAASKHGKAHVIKSHHNVGGLPEHMNLKLVEPLRELFKDEVRKIGLELGLPYDMVYRHPFPGPGLGVRILGEIKPEYVNILQQADAIFIHELHAADFYHKVSQAFCVFLPVKSVGVVGDARRYSWVVSLRAVETIDFMTARWAHLPYDLLEKVSSRIINEVPAISRVSYDISSKPPATIEWE